MIAHREFQLSCPGNVCPPSSISHPSPTQQVAKQAEQSARVAAVKDAALRDLLAIVGCLEAWSAPIRDAHMRAAAAAVGSSSSSGEGESAEGGGGGGVSYYPTNGGGGGSCYPTAVEGPDGEDLGGGRVTADGRIVTADGDEGMLGPRVSSFSSATGAAAAAAALGPSPPREREAERFAAAHNRKAALAKGIAMFNAGPVKGVRWVKKGVRGCGNLNLNIPIANSFGEADQFPSRHLASLLADQSPSRHLSLLPAYSSGIF